MGDTWLTSDQHFGHTNIIKYSNRPFRDVPEMNAELVRRHNAIVKPDDTVYMLGDLSMNFNRAAEFVPQLNGRKHLIAGNHDEAHPANRKNRKDPDGWLRKYLGLGFETVEVFGTLAVGRIDQDNPEATKVFELALCHMPYLKQEQDMYDLRYQEWRPKDTGLWLLHGHVHDKWKVRGRCINVGVDVWAYAPVHLNEVLSLID